MFIKQAAVILALSTVFITAFGEECLAVPTCSCEFGGDSVPVEPNTAGTEALAGAVGALSGIVATGGGVGIWYLLKGRKLAGRDAYGRSVSDISDDSVAGREKEGQGGKGPPPPYRSPPSLRNTGNKPRFPNIYQAGTNDDINLGARFNKGATIE